MKVSKYQAEAHSRAGLKLKEGVKLTDFNKLWRKTTYLQNDQKEENVKLHKPFWPNDIYSPALLSEYLDSSGQHLKVICEFEANIKSVWFIRKCCWSTGLFYGKKSEKKCVSSHFAVLTLDDVSQHCQ